MGEVVSGDPDEMFAYATELRQLLFALQLDELEAPRSTALRGCFGTVEAFSSALNGVVTDCVHRALELTLEVERAATDLREADGG